MTTIGRNRQESGNHPPTSVNRDRQTISRERPQVIIVKQGGGQARSKLRRDAPWASRFQDVRTASRRSPSAIDGSNGVAHAPRQVAPGRRVTGHRSGGDF